MSTGVAYRNFAQPGEVRFSLTPLLMSVEYGNVEIGRLAGPRHAVNTLNEEWHALIRVERCFG